MRLVVDNLACSRSGRRILEGISFSLSDGQALVVTGRNGAGKSTLLSVLAGQLAAQAGTIETEGAEERTRPECLHLVGHQDGLKTALTAEENLAFARDLLGDPALPPREALGAVGLEHAAKVPVGYLSAGQRRRVALARLLVAHRPLWLLDEPLSALDTGSQQTLIGLMDEHLAKGGQIIVATHQGMDLRNATELRIERANPLPPAGEGGLRMQAGREAETPFSTPPLPVGSADHTPPRTATIE